MARQWASRNSESSPTRIYESTQVFSITLQGATDGVTNAWTPPRAHAAATAAAVHWKRMFLLLWGYVLLALLLGWSKPARFLQQSLLGFCFGAVGVERRSDHTRPQLARPISIVNQPAEWVGRVDSR